MPRNPTLYSADYFIRPQVTFIGMFPIVLVLKGCVLKVVDERFKVLIDSQHCLFGFFRLFVKQLIVLRYCVFLNQYPFSVFSGSMKKKKFSLK